MPGVSIDDFGASFIDYIPGVTDSLNNTVTLRKYARKDYKWEGANIQFTVHTARNHGIGNIEDGGAIPVADKQDYIPAQAFRRFFAGSVQISDGQLANAATSKRAAIDVVTSELRGLLDGMAKYEEYMAYRDGTGVVGLLGTDITGTTWGATDARLLWDGQTYEIRDAAAIGTLHGTVTVNSVARALDANNQFAVTSAAALPAAAAATDFIVWPNAVNRAVTGLSAMIDDASETFQNVDTSVYPRYTSPVLDGGGTNRALSPTMHRQMLAMLNQESGDASMTTNALTVLTNTWQLIEQDELYAADMQVTPDTTTTGMAAPNFKSSHGKLTVKATHDCPYNTMFYVDFSQIFRAVQSELDWRRNAGSIFTPSLNSTVWRATAWESCEYFIKQRNKCGKIEDLAETVTTAY